MNTYIRLMLAIVLMAASTLVAFPMELINRQFVQSGNKMDSSEPVMSPLPIEFSLVDPSMQGEWIVEQLNEYGEYYLMLTSRNTGGPLHVDPEKLEWRYSYRDKTLPRYHAYILRISFYADDSSCDSVQLRWVLLPKQPEISDVSFVFEYNWEEDRIWPNGVLRMKVTSENMESCCLWASDSFLFGSFDMFKCGFPYEVDSSTGTYLEYDAEWGEYIAIEACNKFGTIYGETIYTTDYIHDPDVLARIEELRQGLSVESVSGENAASTFKSDGNAIQFQTCPKTAMIYDMSGRIVYSGSGESRIDISGFPSGLYILSYQTDSTLNQSKFFKP
ncbi:MAG: T9SS type A sorting domain-containing protein [Muribaculum sp.]|nr:T9SS type A sorting domain-containing protein [Muribaculum sp.]